jgi:hypothetical protein
LTIATDTMWSSCEIPMLYPRYTTRAALRLRNGILLSPDPGRASSHDSPSGVFGGLVVIKVILTHAVEDVERWLSFKGERAASIGAMGGANVVDHVAADGSKNVAISMDVADMGAIQSGLASPPPELAAAMQRHGVIPPVTAHVEK